MTLVPLILLLVIIINIFMNLKDKKIDFIALLLFWPLAIFLSFYTYLFEYIYLAPIPVAIYYIVRLIKTRKYITGMTFLVQIVLTFIITHLMGKYESTICSGWCVGSLVLFGMFLMVIGYMVVINVITFIVNKVIESKRKEI